MAVDTANIPAVTSAKLAAVTTVSLLNSSQGAINGVTMTSVVETGTPGAEETSLSIGVMASGAPVTLVKFNGKSTGNPIEIPSVGAQGAAIMLTAGADQLIAKPAAGNRNIGMGCFGNGATYMFANNIFGLALQGDGSVTDVALATNSALANAATTGFAHMPQCETTGVMTGVPALQSGFFAHHAPFCFNRADNTFNIYNTNSAAWKRTVALT